ncbi:MAG: DUF1190 domain-containing protein [Rhodospirillaceae bacterium]|nr:DUF1190 domain-containing protein [Rhodospirillaceae bacterium]
MTIMNTTPLRKSRSARKSRYVSVLLAGAAAVALSACDDGTNNMSETIYGDTTTCAQDFGSQACADAQNAAKAEHIQQAPKFATKEECEAAGFSACEVVPAGTAVTNADGTQTQQASSGGGMFMPMMMGYMMGRMMGGGMSGPARPVYANRDGYLYTGGTNVGRVAPGTTSLSGSRVAMRAPERGGFSGSANRFASGGGS